MSFKERKGKKMNVLEFYRELDKLYPTSLSCPWDNDGVMCCTNPDAPVQKVLVALDATKKVLDYAAANGFDMVLTHHPLLFKGPKSIVPNTATGGRVITAVGSNITVLSMHTRLDAGEGGVNDCLASALGLSGPLEVFGDDESPSLGRIGVTEIEDARTFAAHVKATLNAPAVCAYLCHPVKRVAVCGGSGEDLVLPALAAGAGYICHRGMRIQHVHRWRRGRDQCNYCRTFSYRTPGMSAACMAGRRNCRRADRDYLQRYGSVV